MKQTVLCALVLAVSCVAGARPTLPAYTVKSLQTTCAATMAEANKLVARMERTTSGAGLLPVWNKALILIEDAQGPIDLVANVHPDKQIREAAEACLLKLTSYGTELFQNEKLYRNTLAVKGGDAIDRKFRQDLINGFEDTGVALGADKRKRMKQILDKLEELRQAFDRNIRDDPSRVTMTDAEMVGLTESFKNKLKRDANNNFVLTLDTPTYAPFMQLASTEAARKKLYEAKQSEGGKANLEILKEMAGLRREMASLFGLASFADFQLRRRMVKNSETVIKFLADVRAALDQVEKREVEELRALKAADAKQPLEQVTFGRWDLSYYQERVRKERFSIDQEALRRYFPTEASVNYTMLLAEMLYGVKFKRVELPAWHKDVRYYDVLDAKSGKYISGIYLDLFPREGKYNHAAAWPVRGVSRAANRTPISVLVTNFNRDGLNHDELETLLHEFGHVLHGVLSTTRWNFHAGTSTMRDFVEAPSQMFEEWGRREETLALFKRVCADCPQLSREQIAKLDEARRYGKGIHYSRQHLYASYDMALVGSEIKDPLDTWAGMEGRTPTGYLPGTIFPAGFGHIAGGYAAGYYGYMWSEVIALDMLSSFGSNLLNPRVGQHYRNTILANGGQIEADRLVQMFLGRPPSSEAFYKEITGQRK